MIQLVLSNSPSRAAENSRIYTSIILTVIRNLRPPSPYHLSTSRDQSQLTDIDLDNGSLGQDTQLRIHGVLRVLLNADDRQLHSDAEFGVRDIGLLVTQTHGPNKPLVLDGSSREIGPDKRGLGDHSFPTLLRSLLPRLDDLEHLILSNTADFRKRHAELGGFLITLVLDGRGEGFGGCGIRAVEQVVGERCAGGLCGG